MLIVECAWFAAPRHADLQGGESVKGVDDTRKPNPMKRSILGWLKKPRTDMVS